MANTDTLITDLAARGVILQAEGAYLRARGPLDDETRALIRANKARLLAALVQQPESALPADVCPCGSRHFWLSPDGWRCSDCYPWPAPFQGETCTVPMNNVTG